MRETINLNKKAYISQGKALLMKMGVPEKHAEIEMNIILDADLRGIYTHGIFRLPRYVEQLKNNYINPKPSLAFSGNKGVKNLDGDHGLGGVVAFHGMREAINIANNNGVGVVGVKKGNHFGTAAYFAEMASQQNLIGISLTNSSPSIAPTGSIEPVIGNNPWSISSPSNIGFPLTLDIANSIVAKGKLRVAQANGETIPKGWALDGKGKPTNDPAKALKGIVLPIGGHKGYGISFMIEILSGILTGSDFSLNMVDHDANDKRNVGHLFIAINIESFMSLEEFLNRIDEFVQNIKNANQIDESDKIYVPGEIEAERKKQSHETIEIPISSYEKFKEVCAAFNVDFA